MITDPTITTTMTTKAPPVDLATWAIAHGRRAPHQRMQRRPRAPRAPRARTTKKAPRRTHAEEAWPFSCLRCGDLILVVDNTYAEETRVRHIISCHCGGTPSGVAGVLHERRLRFYCHSGMLERDHRVSWDESPLETAATSERHHTQVACRACLRAAEEATWTPADPDGGATTDEPTITRRPDIWTCACVSCGEEVPFAFSEPNRGGTIWPILAHDFDPARAPYPEPRFADAWCRRDWLFVVAVPTER
jgi:hypothetical protein